MIEEIKAYSKTYENDKVTVIDLRKSHSRYLDQEPYYRLKEIQRILEEKIVGFLRMKKNEGNGNQYVKGLSVKEGLLVFFHSFFLFTFLAFWTFRFTKRLREEQ